MDSAPLGPVDDDIAIANALADQFEALYEARPHDPRVHRDGDLLAFSFEGALNGADEALLDGGRGDQTRAFRESFLDLVAGELGAVVSALTGSRVSFFSAAFDVVPRTTNCYFTLVPDLRSADERDRAFENWDTQVRRNALDRLTRQADSRAADDRLQRLLEEVRKRGSAGGG